MENKNIMGNRIIMGAKYKWYPISEGGGAVKDIMRNNQTLFDFLINIIQILKCDNGKISKEKLKELTDKIILIDPKRTGYILRHIANNQTIILKLSLAACELIDLSDDKYLVEIREKKLLKDLQKKYGRK